MLIDGIHVPLTVPFQRDGTSYLRKLEQNVRRYSLTPAAGLVALGSGGEADALSDDEAAEFLRVVGEVAGPEKVLVAGVAKNSVRGAVALMEIADEAGFDAALVSAPTDWTRLSQAEIRVFFEAVADGSPLPVVLWSDGIGPGFACSVEMLGKLAKHPNVIGVYDADLSIERLSAIDGATKGVMRDVTVTPVFSPVTRRMMRGAGGDSGLVSAEALGGGTAVAVAPKVAVKTRTKVVGFQVMGAGRATELLPLLQAGVSGAMPAMAACAPQATYEVYAAFKDGDAPLSAEKAERLREAEAVLLELGVAAVKYGCDLNGYYGGTPRLPRLALDGAERSRVEAALREVRN